MRTQSTSALQRQELVKLYRKALAQGVPLEKLEHKVQHFLTRNKVSVHVEKEQDQVKTEKLKKKIPAIVRFGSALLPVALVTIGVVLLGSALFPIISYYFTQSPMLQANTLTSPIPREQVLDINPIVIAQASSGPLEGMAQAYGEEVAQDETEGPIILDAELDYTNLSNWFDETQSSALQLNEAEAEYVIEIPKLKVTSAKVVVGGTNLNKSLIQYPGTALPGQFGAPVVFGHSVLRQFYNPSEKNPRRYTSIFSTIMTLSKGDEIFVTYDGIKYRYIVQEKTEVKPEDVYILSQRYDAKLLKLVTCTPEGTYLRRGVITAVLAPN